MAENADLERDMQRRINGQSFRLMGTHYEEDVTYLLSELKELRGKLARATDLLEGHSNQERLHQFAKEVTEAVYKAGLIQGPTA